MVQNFLAHAVEDVPRLRAIFITAMPDALLYDYWISEKHQKWAAEEVASYFGDLIRANREGLKALGSWSSEMQVTIESADALVVLRELTPDFVCGGIFDREAPLGMVRLHLKRVTERLLAHLPKFEVEERPRGVRVVEFLQRYAPDPHMVLLRVAMQTGLEMDQLQAPEKLSQDEVAKIEEASRRILGLESLNV
jgi:hypothetical protein